MRPRPPPRSNLGPTHQPFHPPQSTHQPIHPLAPRPYLGPSHQLIHPPPTHQPIPLVPIHLRPSYRPVLSLNPRHNQAHPPLHQHSGPTYQPIHLTTNQPSSTQQIPQVPIRYDQINPNQIHFMEHSNSQINQVHPHQNVIEARNHAVSYHPVPILINPKIQQQNYALPNSCLPTTNPQINQPYLITNLHHTLMNPTPLPNAASPTISTRSPEPNHPLTNPMKQNASSPTPPQARSPDSKPRSPTAPRLSLVDPVAALWARSRGPPPEYATIDPRNLRARNLRSIFTRKGNSTRKSRSSSKDRMKHSGTGRSKPVPSSPDLGHNKK